MNRILSAFILMIISLCFGCSYCPDLTHEIERYQDKGNGLDGIMLNFSFNLDGKEYPAGIKDNNITGLVPYGVDRSRLVAEFEDTGHLDVLVDGIEQNSGVTENDFTKPVIYRLVDLKDDSFVEYTVNIQNAPNDEASLFALTLTVGDKQYVCLVDNKTLFAYVPYGTDMRAVSLNYVISEQAGVSLNNAAFANGSVADLSNDITLKVSAQDSRFEKDYRVIVKYEKNTRAELSSFQLNTTNEIYNCPISGNEMKTDVAYGTNLTNIIPKFSISYGAKLYDANGTEVISGETAVTFKKGEAMYFNVVSEDGAFTNGYSLMINELPNHEAKIVTFSIKINNATYPANIDGNTISVTLPPTTNLIGNIAQYTFYTLSAGASLYVNADQINIEDANNYIIKRFYRVISADSQKVQDYIAHINIQKNTEAILQNFELVFDNGSAGCDNPVGEIISCRAPFGANRSNGVALLMVPYGAKIYTGSIALSYDNTSGKYNYTGDFSSPVTFRVESENNQNNVYYTVQTERGCLNLTSQIDKNATSYFTNFNSIMYGLGLFHTNAIMLKDNCGYNLDDNLSDDFDINDYGTMNQNKFVRITVNGKNIKDTSFMGGFNIISTDLGNLSMPQGNNCYIDRMRGIFILPAPFFAHLFNDIDSLFTIYPGYVRDFQIIEATQNYAYGSFENGSYVLTANAANTGMEGHLFNMQFFPFGNNNIPLTQGTMAIDFSRSTQAYTESLVEITIIDVTTANGYIIENYAHYYPRYSERYTKLSRLIAGIAYSEGNGPGGNRNERLYINWNASGNIKIYTNESLVKESSSTVVNNVLIKVRMMVKIGNNSMNAGDSANIMVHSFKLWNEVLPTDITWMQNSFVEDALHPIYGSANNYKINDIKVSYYYNQ